MADITLTEDRRISTLSLDTTGNTIQLAGHSLVIDADAVSYPVTITNSGPDANLELRDLGRIKLNAPLPASVHPWIDSANPLPVAAEPGIDGDPYRTSLNANARAEIQLADTFGLGGGAASLPTKTREGAFWDLADSYPTNTSVKLKTGLPIHVGDFLVGATEYRQPYWFTVLSYDPQTYTATVNKVIAYRTSNMPWIVLAGGVLVNALSTGQNVPILDGKMSSGTINIIGNRASGNTHVAAISGTIVSHRTAWASNASGTNTYNYLCASGATLQCKQIGALRLSSDGETNGISVLAEEAVFAYFGASGANNFSFGKGFARYGAHTEQPPGTIQEFGSFVVVQPFSFKSKTAAHFVNGSIDGGATGDDILEGGGVVSLVGDGNYYHAPATAADVTWRYTDRTVAPGATLRLRCAWLREGSAETRASIAVTDPATWWPQLWPLGAEALASVEFEGGTAEWRGELLTWRNTSPEVVQVRVWECVTGSTEGGYLQVEEIKGGPL